MVQVSLMLCTFVFDEKRGNGIGEMFTTIVSKINLHVHWKEFRFSRQTSKKMIFFWNIASFSLAEGYNLDNERRKHLRNIGKILSDYKAQQPRRQPS
jgi:hypothetical protein